MSTSGYARSSKMGFHNRKESEELDVFEATRYFSGTRAGLKMSMDFPRAPQHSQTSLPERRFLNSIFSQTSRKKSNMMAETPLAGRTRSSGDSHCRSSSTDTMTSSDSNSACYSSPASGWKRPPATLDGKGKLDKKAEEMTPEKRMRNAPVDDGVDSDSSSDLFELQNYDADLNVYTSGLPVFETTQMSSIIIGPSVPNSVSV